MTPRCGWLISGDPLRPCVSVPGHKSPSHTDASRREKNRAYDRQRYPEVRDAKLAYHRERKNDPEVQVQQQAYQRGYRAGQRSERRRQAER